MISERTFVMPQWILHIVSPSNRPRDDCTSQQRIGADDGSSRAIHFGLETKLLRIVLGMGIFPITETKVSLKMITYLCEARLAE